MIHVASGWLAGTDQGPGWLFVRLQEPKGSSVEQVALAEEIWELLSQQFTYRVVLEMDNIQNLPSHIIGQLMLLRKRLLAQGGMLRLCNLSDSCRQLLHTHGLDGVLPLYNQRDDAIMGRCHPYTTDGATPNKPR